MQTYPRPLLSQAPRNTAGGKRTIVILIVAAIALVTVVSLCTAAWLTYVYFFPARTGATIELVGRWKQEQPLGDAEGSAGRKIWIYNFFAWGEFQVHAELQVRGRPAENITSDSKGRWTLSHEGNLKMTFADDGKTESVMLTRITDKKVAVDKGSKRTFLERME
jgi:hypothetical protein